MRSKWPLVPFSEIMHRVDRAFVIDDGVQYLRVGVRWYGMGAFIRDSAYGTEIRRKQQWRVEKGDVIYNKLFAWKGAFAVADESVHGHIASDKFPTYQHDRNRLDLNYLRYFFRSSEIAEQAASLSRGGAAISKFTLNPPQFWKLTIPLPPLTEQQRIVARIDALAARIDEAKRLRAQAVAEVEVVMGAAIAHILADEPQGHIRDVIVEKPRNGWSVRCDNNPSGIRVLTLSAVTGFFYQKDAFKTTSTPTDPNAHYWLEPGDILITRSNTPDLVGHAAIYDGEPFPCIYPDLIMRMQVNINRANGRFVWYWMRNPRVRDYIRKAAKGTSPTMKKISQPVVMNIPFPTQLGSLEQSRIASYLDDLQARVGAVGRMQVETQTELDTLLPSILDQAFRGELL